MARKKAKAANSNLQLAVGRKRKSEVGSQKPVKAKATSTTKSKPGRRGGFFHFPEVTDKIVEDVEFATSGGYDVISLSFRDKTCLDFVIDTCFTVRADYLDRGHGDHRVLRSWPPMHSSE